MTGAAGVQAESRHGWLYWQVSDALVLTGRSLRHIQRSPALLFFSTVQPIMFVVLFRYVLGGAIKLPPGVSYVNYLMAGIFVNTVAFGSFSTGIGLAEDLQNGLIDRFRSLPMSRAAVLVGRTLSDLVRNVFTGAVMFAVGVLVGFNPQGGALQIAAAIGLLLLFGYAFSWIGATIGLAVRACGTRYSIMGSMRRTALAAVALLALAGCGSAGPRAAVRATLVLDFIPNAVHAGIYRALAAGYYRRAGIDLTVIPPGSTSTTLALIDAGKAQFGLADGIDVAQQIAMGRDEQAIMAIVQRPLGAPIALASEHLRSAADLAGKLVGITGVPSDLAALDTVVAHAGGDPARVRVVTIGFAGVADLEAGRIAAFTGYWPDDGVALAVSGHPITVFRLDANGGPPYPGLVAFTTRALIRRDPGLVRAFVRATVRGYEDTLRDPARSLAELLARNPTIEPRLARASLRTYLPVFDAGGVPYGTLVAARVAALASWLRAHRLISRPVAVARFGTNAFLPSR